MTAMFATQQFTIQLASGASHLVILGALRDSLHPAVTSAPGLFSASPPVVHPMLRQYLNAYPGGEVK